MTAPSPAGLSPLLDQLDEARAAATPGPWKIRDDGVTVEIEGGDRESVRDKHGFHDADAALIVAAVNALPLLTAAIRAVAELTDSYEWQAAESLSLAKERGDTPVGHYLRGQHVSLLVAARSLRAAIAAALTPGADTAGATA